MNLTRQNFGNAVFDFVYRGKGNLNKKDLQKFIDKEDYKWTIQKINIVYPSIDIDAKDNNTGKSLGISLRM